MAKTRNHAVTVTILCAMTAAMLLMQGCRKTTSAPPQTVSERQTASTNKTASAESEKTKPRSVSTGTDDVARPKKTTAGKPTAPKLSEDQAFAPKPTPLPKADIDSHDPKYAEVRDGKMQSAKIEADGKPVTVLYLPPYMFTIALTKNGQEKVYLTFGTVTASGEAGNRMEIHILARHIKPADSKFEKVALIYSDKTKPGQKWTATAAGMDLRIEALDFGESNESPFPGTGMGWLKLKITAK